MHNYSLKKSPFYVIPQAQCAMSHFLPFWVIYTPRSAPFLLIVLQPALLAFNFFFLLAGGFIPLTFNPYTFTPSFKHLLILRRYAYSTVLMYTPDLRYDKFQLNFLHGFGPLSFTRLCFLLLFHIRAESDGGVSPAEDKRDLPAPSYITGSISIPGSTQHPEPWRAEKEQGGRRRKESSIISISQYLLKVRSQKSEENKSLGILYTVTVYYCFVIY